MFDKLDIYLDYNNHYSLNKALSTLQREFNIAISRNNQRHVREVIDTLNRMYDKLTSTYRESADYGETMSYSQKLIANKMRWLQSYFAKTLKTKLDIPSYEQEIEQAIAP